MNSFLKDFLAGEKSPEEKALHARQETEKKRDVLTVEGFEMDEDEGCGEDDLAEYNSSPCGACCGGGCRS